MTEIKLFNTPQHECPYLENKQSVTQFVNPEERLDIGIYTFLSRSGFRRSGEHIYRPRCPDCNACRAIRVIVDDFKPSRSQRRILNKASEFTIKAVPAHYNETHYMLYERYISSRHYDGDMYPADPDLYQRFLLSDWSKTRFMEVWQGDRLAACGVYDQLFDGLSAVYAYFHPEFSRYSPGKLLILAQIEEARRLHLPYVYLGYQIDDCKKMNYKTQFYPTEQLIDDNWQQDPR